MANRTSRWPGNNHPLTAHHGGSAKAALLAVVQARKRNQRSASLLVLVQQPQVVLVRRDRLRPRKINESQMLLVGAVWEKSNGRCAYCGLPMLWPRGSQAYSFTLDHDLPKSRGGTNALENLVGAHKKCNEEKADRTGQEYRAALASNQPA